MFVPVEHGKLTRNLEEIILQRCLKIKRTAIEEKTITSFTVFAEAGGQGISYVVYKTTDFGIPGSLIPFTIKQLRDTNAEKILHMNPEWRAQGNVSTHAPEFLKQPMIIIVIGSKRFIAEFIDLYLEREGLLRTYTIEFLKILFDLVYFGPKSEITRDNFLHLMVESKAWYEGNINALVYLHGPSEITGRHSEQDMVNRFGGGGGGGGTGEDDGADNNDSSQAQVDIHGNVHMW